MINDSALTGYDSCTAERLKKSPFHFRLAALNIRGGWSAWNGYKSADHYHDPIDECFCIRNSCATYDISPMQKYTISGADAEVMLNRMMTRDISVLKQDRVSYVCWCNDEGEMIDHGAIFKLAADKFMLTTASPNMDWLGKSAFGYKNIKVEDSSDKIAGLSIQGPASHEVLKNMSLQGLEELKPFGIKYFSFKHDALMVSRTGFTGDLGYELWIKPELALQLWDALYAAGEAYGIKPFGETAAVMARLEAGFIMSGMEFNKSLKSVRFQFDQTPFELSLGWLVDFKKPHFNGRLALLQNQDNGAEYGLVKLVVEGNKPAQESLLYSDYQCNNEIGFITSAIWSPTVNANIAFAMVKTKYLKGDILAAVNDGKESPRHCKMIRCTIKNKSFWAPKRARLTPPQVY